MPRLLLCLILLSLTAAADVVYLKGGKKFHGKVVQEDPEVVVNIFNSAVPGMTLGVRKFPKDKVKKIVRTLPAPHCEFQLRLKSALDASACIELADWCAKEKLKRERNFALEMALRLDPGSEAARKALGSKAPKGSWIDQMALARLYVGAGEDEARAEALASIRKDRDFPFKELYLQRALRSARQAKGYQKDRPVALRADKLLPGARYTLLVPEKYDPMVPTPLVFGLHGGGAGGADGKLVVGTGYQAMNFYRGGCEREGWICVCPTALRAGWRSKANSELIDAVLEELFALYNIDENRIYLIGHSMGGGGAWSQGARLPETWACVAPAASFGVTGIEKFKKTGTGFYVYHSDNDPRCGVGGVRPSMENLPGSDADFVYTELPGRGHSFPSEVVRDMFRFFEARTLSRGPGRFKHTVRPQSSFQRKVSRDERKYLPPLDQTKPAEDKLSKLIKKLATGGGVAKQVVPELVKHPDEKVAGRVAKLMLKPDSTADVRRFCARVLKERKAADQLKALGRVLLIETDSNALAEMLSAIEAIGDPSAGPDLLRFLKKHGDYLGQRARGNQVDHSDWSTILPPMAQACALVGTYKPDKAAGVIVKTVLVGVLTNTTVIFDSQNQQPLHTGQAVARAACEALVRLGDAGAIPALEKLAAAAPNGVTVTRKYGPVAVMSDWPKDQAIASLVREALRDLKG